MKQRSVGLRSLDFWKRMYTNLLPTHCPLLHCHYLSLYYGAIECLNLNWLTNVLRCAIIFRETHSNTWLYHSQNDFCYFKGLTTEKTTKTHNDPGQINKYSKQKDKIDRSCPRFCHKIKFYYVQKAHSLLSLPLSVSPWQTHKVCTHLNISTNVVSTTLMILSVTV